MEFERIIKKEVCVMAENEAVRRIQASIDMLRERMRIDSNDLEYETHLRQKRHLQRILDRIQAREQEEETKKS
jgi:hypothetical protein